MLATDANQGWSVDQALEMLPQLAAFDLRWLEERILCQVRAYFLMTSDTLGVAGRGAARRLVWNCLVRRRFAV
jgi:hypothetical protein